MSQTFFNRSDTPRLYEIRERQAENYTTRTILDVILAAVTGKRMNGMFSSLINAHRHIISRFLIIIPSKMSNFCGPVWTCSVLICPPGTSGGRRTGCFEYIALLTVLLAGLLSYTVTRYTFCGNRNLRGLGTFSVRHWLATNQTALIFSCPTTALFSTLTSVRIRLPIIYRSTREFPTSSDNMDVELDIASHWAFV